METDGIIMDYKDKKEELSEEVLTVPETASMLGVTRQNVHRLIKNGTYKPFKYIAERRTGKMMPLLLKSEVLDVERKKLLEKRKFREEHIIASLAKKIMKKRLPDFIEDIDNGLIDEQIGPNRKTGYIKLDEFVKYARKYGINLDNLINSDSVSYLLLDNGITDDIVDFLKKYGIKPTFDLQKDRKYALIDKNLVEQAIEKEIETRGIK
jgi:hypothetical protein